MDRKQLKEARLTIARLVRSNAAVTTKRKKDKPPEPDGYRQTMHLGLDATDIANLDKIAEHLKGHPTIGRMHSNIGREKAARFAIAHYAKHPPAYDTTS
jgi:hypothetical protein